MYKKIVQDGYIVAVGEGDFGNDITQSEYNALREILQSRPEETAEIGYRPKTDLTWEPYEKEPDPEPEPDDAEYATAGKILMGVEA